MSKKYSFFDYLKEGQGGAFKWGWFALPLIPAVVYIDAASGTANFNVIQDTLLLPG